ncbi:hypothetical protein ScPMuIL_012287 [Solemya velum]
MVKCQGINPKTKQLCNFELPDDFNLCPKCGKVVEREGQLDESYVLCTGVNKKGNPCGFKFVDCDMNFCPKCGTKNECYSSSPSSESPPSDNKSTCSVYDNDFEEEEPRNTDENDKKVDIENVEDGPKETEVPKQLHLHPQSCLVQKLEAEQTITSDKNFNNSASSNISPSDILQIFEVNKSLDNRFSAKNDSDKESQTSSPKKLSIFSIDKADTVDKLPQDQMDIDATEKGKVTGIEGHTDSDSESYNNDSSDQTTIVVKEESIQNEGEKKEIPYPPSCELKINTDVESVQNKEGNIKIIYSPSCGQNNSPGSYAVSKESDLTSESHGKLFSVKSEQDGQNTFQSEDESNSDSETSNSGTGQSDIEEKEMEENEGQEKKSGTQVRKKRGKKHDFSTKKKTGNAKRLRKVMSQSKVLAQDDKNGSFENVKETSNLPVSDVKERGKTGLTYAGAVSSQKIIETNLECHSQQKNGENGGTTENRKGGDETKQGEASQRSAPQLDEMNNEVETDRKSCPPKHNTENSSNMSQAEKGKSAPVTQSSASAAQDGPKIEPEKIEQSINIGKEKKEEKSIINKSTKKKGKGTGKKNESMTDQGPTKSGNNTSKQKRGQEAQKSTDHGRSSIPASRTNCKVYFHIFLSASVEFDPAKQAVVIRNDIEDFKFVSTYNIVMEYTR